MCSTDVPTSRASGSRTCHVLPVCLLVCFLSRFTCFLTLPLWTVDSSMLTISHYAFPFRLVCRVIIPGLMTPLRLTPVCTCIYSLDIYTIEDGDSSLIFNLLCNHPTSVTCEIPRTLLVPSSSLAKATASRSIRVSFCQVAYR